jgi:hypothetical protein
MQDRMHVRRDNNGEGEEIKEEIEKGKMVKKVTEASQAVAEAVKLCKPEVIPVYPITPQRI